MTSVIYRMINLANGKLYVGSAVNFDKRISAHVWHLKNKSHYNKYIQNAWDFYGEECFKFEILEIVDDVKNLIEREQHWINVLNPVNPNGYNIRSKADTNLGTKRSDETKAKMSSWQIGRKMSDEAKLKMSKVKIGYKFTNRKTVFSEETKLRMRLSKLGKPHKEEHKEKIRKASIRNRNKILNDNLFCHISALMSMGF